MNRRLPPLILGAGAIVCSVGFMISEAVRDSSPVYQDLGLIAFVWQTILLAGGCATIYGVLRGKPKPEAFGLSLVAGGMLMYSAGMVAHGGLAAWTAGIMITKSALSILARVLNVTRGQMWS